jgi:predicted DNA-binding protein with PD1-like motif
MAHIIEDVHEIFGTGTLFPDEEGNPVLHMHMACGRNNNTVTG